MQRSLTLLLAALLAAPTAHAVPFQLSHQGHLIDSAGAPVIDAHTLTATLYDNATGGAAVWSDELATTFDQGFYSVVLGANPSNALDTAVFDGRPLFLAIQLDGGVELPRVPVVSVPYAIRAESAKNVQGGVVDATEIRINGSTVIDASGAVTAPVSFADLTGLPADLEDGDDDSLANLNCATGQVPVFDGLAWGCGAAAPTALDASVITSGTLSIDRLPTGTSSGTLAVGDHTHDAGHTLTGIFAVERIPDLDATKITSGSFNAAQIPNLDATKITSGSFNAAQIPNLDATKITSGVLAKARIPAFTATEVGAVPATGGSFSGDLATTGTLQVGTSSDPCTAATSHGKLRFTAGSLELCTAAGWLAIQGSKNGSTAASAATSCKQLNLDFPALNSGAYWIKPGSGSAYRVYCDMSTRGGGWTLVLKASGSTFEYNSNVWTTTNVVNDSSPDTLWANAKYSAFNDLPMSEILLKSENGNDVHLQVPAAGNTMLSWFQRSTTTLLTVVGGSPNANHLVNGTSPTICGTPYRINTRAGGNAFYVRLGGYWVHQWSCGYGADNAGQPSGAESAGFGLRDDTWGPFVHNQRGFGLRQAHDYDNAPGGGQVSVGGAIYVR